MSAWGTLYGVGVGPGDPELMTVKAVRILATACVLACPAGRDGGPGSAYRVAERHVRPATPVLPLRRGEWERAGEQVLSHLERGESVAFVTLGDPLLYSTFTHLLRAVRARAPEVPVVIVPGISSIQAAAAHLQAPLATGDERLAVLPALYRSGEIPEALELADLVVLLKVRTALRDVAACLRDRGLLGGAVLVEHAGTGDVRVVPGPALSQEPPVSYASLLFVPRSGRRPL
jgi:precorrin-2/cobalt-factor-2 C20-methyltransferase